MVGHSNDNFVFIIPCMMRTLFNMWRWCIFCLALCSSVVGWSQNTVFSVNASTDKMGIKDQIQVDYSVQDAPNLRSIANPKFEDFSVVSGPFSRQSSNISVVGNKMVQSVTITYSYILQPKKTGNLTIPSTIAKDANGEIYESNKLTIQVVNGSLARQQQSRDPFDDPFFNDPYAAMIQRQRQLAAAMQQRRQQQMAGKQKGASQQQEDANVDMDNIYKNLFMRATADKTKVHVGEQITVTYKLYTRIPMNAGISKLPSLNGFWTQDFEIAKGGNVKPIEEVVDGKTYQVFTVKKSALFPQQEGTLTLDPAEAEGVAHIMQRVRQHDPFADMFADDPFFRQAISQMMQDPFGDMFGTSYKDVPVKMKSTPIKITVLPLPEEGKPENFGNAVGNFTIDGRADKTSLTTDDVITYTLKINGSGNLKLIQAPILNLPNGLSTYDPNILDTITSRTTTISGSKIITYAISANVPGDYELPPIPFSYYNPQTGTYSTLHTKPIKIQVEKGKNYNPTLAQKNHLSDIHPIVSSPLKKLVANSKPILFTKGYWSMYALPMLAFVGLLVWRKREEEFSKDTIKLRNRRANKVALRRLSTANKFLQKNEKTAFYEEISKAVWLYLSDKLTIPLSSLSKEKAHEILFLKNVDGQLLSRIDNVMNDCEVALYAPNYGIQQMQRTYSESVDIISKLEETVKS